MLAYKQAGIVRECALSCVNQVCEPLDIILSDDCSGDGTYEILKSVAEQYTGPHHVIARQNKSNLGIAAHWNEILSEFEHDLYIAAAGDDISLPARAQHILKAWEASNFSLDLISSHCTRMDHEGLLHNRLTTTSFDNKTPLDWLDDRPYIIGATHAFTRRLVDKFGPLHHQVGREDQIMVFRALCSGGAGTINEVLVNYRDGGISAKPSKLSGQDLLAWSLKSLANDISETRQLLIDAKTAGLDQRVSARLNKKLQMDLFTYDVMCKPSKMASLFAWLDTSPLPLGWRIKKSISIAFFDVYKNLR